MNTRTIAVAAAAIFAASTFVVSAANAGVACPGANSCKGQSACKGSANACKGQNACKGKGFTETGSSIECQVIKSK